jgi:hypothetical protein
MLNTPRMSRDAIRRKLAEEAMRRGTVDDHGGRDLPDNWLFDLLNYGPFVLASAGWIGWMSWSALFR